MEPTIHHMPDGTPAPAVMTADEVIRFLRLDEVNTKRPDEALRRYRQMGLPARRIGLPVRYLLSEVVEFIEGMPKK